MGMSDTEIHQREILITIRYLFEHSSKTRPATILDICRFGNGFGMKYDDAARKGNKMNRHRVATYLDNLDKIGRDYPELLPFKVMKTPGGKYYAAKRNGITFEDANKILVSIKNSQFLLNDEKKDLMEASAKCTMSVEDRKQAVNASNLSSKTPSSTKLMRLLNKAMVEKKLISLYDSMFKTTAWFRVHSFHQFDRQTHVILIDVENGVPRCIPISDIQISSMEENQVLMSDEEGRGIDSLLNKEYKKAFKTIDDWLEQNVYPQGRGTPRVFRFFFTGSKNTYKKITNSYILFFNDKLETQEKEKEVYVKGQLERHKVYLASVRVSTEAFIRWLSSDLFAAAHVRVEKPLGFNVYMFQRFSQLATLYEKRVNHDVESEKKNHSAAHSLNKGEAAQ